MEKYKAMVATIVANLKKRERDFEFQLFLVDNQREKVHEGKKEHELALTQLEVVSVVFNYLIMKATITNF